MGTAGRTINRMARWFWVLDALVIVAFVVIGRDDHGFVSDASDYARVAAPFLVGLAVAGVSLRAWRDPISLRTGLLLSLGTLLVGMLARRFIWDAGTARTFVLVTAGFLVAGMVGWRLVALAVQRLLSSRRSARSTDHATG